MAPAEWVTMLMLRVGHSPPYRKATWLIMSQAPTPFEWMDKFNLKLPTEIIYICSISVVMRSNGVYITRQEWTQRTINHCILALQSKRAPAKKKEGESRKDPPNTSKVTSGFYARIGPLSSLSLSPCQPGNLFIEQRCSHAIPLPASIREWIISKQTNQTIGFRTILHSHRQEHHALQPAESTNKNGAKPDNWTREEINFKLKQPTPEHEQSIALSIIRQTTSSIDRWFSTRIQTEMMINFKDQEFREYFEAKTMINSNCRTIAFNYCPNIAIPKVTL